MKRIKIHVSIEEPFYNLKRRKHVVIAAITSDNKVLTGTKFNFYPPTITRLLGGGVDKNESSLQSAVREIYEETGIEMDSSELQQIALFEINAIDKNGTVYQNETAAFTCKIPTDAKETINRVSKIQPLLQDDPRKHDINEIVALTLDELKELSEHYTALDKTLWYINPDYFGSHEAFSWHDYGQIYGIIHEEIARILKLRT